MDDHENCCKCIVYHTLQVSLAGTIMSSFIAKKLDNFQTFRGRSARTMEVRNMPHFSDKFSWLASNPLIKNRYLARPRKWRQYNKDSGGFFSSSRRPPPGSALPGIRFLPLLSGSR